MQNKLNPKAKRSYIEFCYILPFILLVAVFAYFPLYGWVYAFHDFVPPKPISNETFVGFKWFANLFSNPVKNRYGTAVAGQAQAISLRF